MQQLYWEDPIRIKKTWKLSLLTGRLFLLHGCWDPVIRPLIGKVGFGADVYDKSSEDAVWRAQVAEQIGTGFTLPNCTDCTEKEKEATGAVASK